MLNRHSTLVCRVFASSVIMSTYTLKRWDYASAVQLVLVDLLAVSYALPCPVITSSPSRRWRSARHRCISWLLTASVIRRHRRRSDWSQVLLRVCDHTSTVAGVCASTATRLHNNRHSGVVPAWQSAVIATVSTRVVRELRRWRLSTFVRHG